MDPALPGHFTTMQARGGAVQGLDLHLERLRAAQRVLRGVALDEAALRAQLRQALADAGGTCTVRIVCRHRSAPEVEVGPPRAPEAAALRVRSHRGLRASPRLKHLDLAFQTAARQAARDAGFDDALLVGTDGRIAEGTFWNVLLQDGHGLVWPDAPVLEGVTQRRLQAALDRAAMPQRRTVVRLEDLRDVRAAFVLNSRGLQVIGTIDDRRLPGDAAMAERLRMLLAGDPWQLP